MRIKNVILFASLFMSGLVHAQLIDVDTLKTQIKQPNVILVDVRQNSTYREGHIEGAVNLPVNETFSGTDDTGFIAAPSVIQKLLNRIGMTNSAQVILYDDGYFKDVSRMYWALKVYGHEQVLLLDGGYLAWLKSGFAVTQTIPQVTRSGYIPTLDPDHLTTLFSARLASSSNSAQIIDARVYEEYIGESSKAQRFGHIPSAINIPSALNYQLVDGVPQLKSFTELEKVYASLDKSKPVITYCNKGKESAITHMVLSQLGFNVSVYDGGWIEWGNHQSLPVINKSNANSN